MNLFGVEISMGKNGKYVSPDVCQTKHIELEHSLDRRFSELQKHLDTRIEDLKDFLLRNGKH